MLLVRVSASPYAHLRAGIVVPRYKHSAVDRNRLKRRLRELVRLHVLPLGFPLDLVIWAQRAGYEASFEQLQAEVESLVPRIGRFVKRES